MDTLRIRLFGRLQISSGQPGPPKFPTGKAQELLYYLLLHRQRSHSRSILASLFWPDTTEEQARKCLRTTFWRLRCALEGDRESPQAYFICDNDTIRFDNGSDHWLDVEEFEHCLSPLPALAAAPIGERVLEADLQERFTRAIQLYQGDLLEGCYEDWCLYERERLQSMYLSALGHLMACHRHQGAYATAIRYGQRILNHDPLLEEVHRELMRLYCLSGNRGAALRQYAACRAMLMDELDVEPMEETTALAHAIRNDVETMVTRVRSDREQAAPARPPTKHIAPKGDSPQLAAQVRATLDKLRGVQAEFQGLSGRLQKGVEALEMIQHQLRGRSSS